MGRASIVRGAVALLVSGAVLLVGCSTPKDPAEKDSESASQSPSTAPSQVTTTTTTTISTTTTTIPDPVSVIWPAPGQVALTFDDGPLPQYTAPLLDYLRDENVPATFFVLGRSAAEWPELIARMAEDKHSVQNHTWDHPYLWNLSNEGIQGQVGQLNDLVVDLTGSPTTCVRPPYGATNQRVAEALAAVGKQVTMWNADSQDWRGGTAEEIAFRAVASAEARNPTEGIVVVLHDGGGERPTLVDATRLIVEHYRSTGHQFVVLCR